MSYYRKNEMTHGDNPPIGILLCTGKDDELVQYATDIWDKNLFVSDYKLNLPSENELKQFIESKKQILENLKQSSKNNKK